MTANQRGTIEFDTPAGTRISVLGLRFSPPNNALTTIPALANVGTGGGSIPHLASGGDGWSTPEPAPRPPLLTSSTIKRALLYRYRSRFRNPAERPRRLLPTLKRWRPGQRW